MLKKKLILGLSALSLGLLGVTVLPAVAQTTDPTPMPTPTPTITPTPTPTPTPDGGTTPKGAPQTGLGGLSR